jgi:NADH-quinone oxidoreductase subunit G
MDTVKVTIDGRELTVEKGKTVLQAALENSIELPYYCYHPGLGVDGSCRVCIVKIEKMPKLQTSCSTTCTDGMVVHTQAPDVVEARAGVFEFLLINHPLDCPVCDKGGECPLQDFSYAFGPDRSRMEFPRRTFDGEGVEADVDFGPTLMLNRNRCILCTRCVRFMRDVDGDAQIGITDRGAGSEISTYKEEGVHSLLSGNLMDVCPVGAITTRDYRFKSRPWDNPLAGDTICTFCSKGCSTTAWMKAKPEWARAAQMARITPRFNPDVNGYWMCDIGRFDYHWVEDDRRLTQPLVRAANGVQQPVNWHDAWRALRARLGDAPDGSAVAVASGFDFSGTPQVHVSAADGSGETLTLENALNPAWSPDGTQLAFQRQVDPSEYFDGRPCTVRTWVADADGSNERQLEELGDGCDFGPAWSPDGTRLMGLWIDTDPANPDPGPFYLSVVTLDGSEEPVHLLDAAGASWQPVVP